MIFYQSAVATAVYFNLVCWGSAVGAVDINRMNKLIRKGGFEIGWTLLKMWSG